MTSTGAGLSGFSFKKVVEIINQQKVTINHKVLELISNELTETLNQIKIQKQKAEPKTPRNLDLTTEEKRAVLFNSSRNDFGLNRSFENMETKEFIKVVEDKKPISHDLVENKPLQKAAIFAGREGNYSVQRFGYGQTSSDLNFLQFFNPLIALNELPEALEAEAKKRKSRKYFKKPTSESQSPSYYL